MVVDAGEQDLDLVVMEQLLAAGADLTKPTHVLFYVYMPTEAGARAIAQSGADATIRAEVEPSASDDGTWLCLFQGTLVPEIETIREYGRRLQALAAVQGGEYDGWEAAVVN